MKHTFVKTRFIAYLLPLMLMLSLKAQDTLTSAPLSDLPTVKIGNQIWMTKNLDVVTFRNGDTIPEAKNFSEFQEAGKKAQPAWCKQNLYRFLEFNQKPVKMYNWYAVNDSRGLAPKGFHAPSKAEWDSLLSYIGSSELVSKNLDSIGFVTQQPHSMLVDISAYPGGYQMNYVHFSRFGANGDWWNYLEKEANAWYYALDYLNDSLPRNHYVKSYGFSVRCLRD